MYSPLLSEAILFGGDAANILPSDVFISGYPTHFRQNPLSRGQNLATNTFSFNQPVIIPNAEVSVQSVAPSKAVAPTPATLAPHVFQALLTRYLILI